MNPKTLLKWTVVLATAVFLTGCATKTVVSPRPVHVVKHAPHHVVYNVKPAKKHCWRHRGHWDCR